MYVRPAILPVMKSAALVAGMALTATGIGLCLADGHCGSRLLLLAPAAGLTILLGAYCWMTDGDWWKCAVSLGVVWILTGVFIRSNHGGGWMFCPVCRWGWHFWE